MYAAAGHHIRPTLASKHKITLLQKKISEIINALENIVHCLLDTVQ
jgi:hypothetical protein